MTSIEEQPNHVEVNLSSCQLPALDDQVLSALSLETIDLDLSSNLFQKVPP